MRSDEGEALYGHRGTGRDRRGLVERVPAKWDASARDGDSEWTRLRGLVRRPRRSSRHAGPLLHLPQGCVLTAQAASSALTFLPGGLVLWSRSFTPAASQSAASSASPVNSLIREALIEGRTAEDKYDKDGYSVRWSFVNDLELIFVVRPPAVLIVRSRSAHPLNVGSIPADSSTHLRRRAPRGPQDPFRQALRAISSHFRRLSARRNFRKACVQLGPGCNHLELP